MPAFVYDVYNFLNAGDNNIIIFSVFMAVCLLAAALRIIACAGIQTKLSVFRYHAKPVESRADLDKIRSALLKNIVTDYIRNAEKNVSAVHLEAIVQKHMTRLNFIGWSYRGMEGFATSIEYASPLLGIILAIVFEDFRFAYGAAAALAYVVMKLLSAVFDVGLVMEKLKCELIEYVEREAGQYYAGDYGSALMMFRNEISQAMNKQSQVLGETLEGLRTGISASVEKSLAGMSVATAETVKNMGSYGEVMKTPLREWADTISEASGLQAESGEAARLMIKSGEIIAEELNGMKNHVSAISESAKAIQESQRGVRSLTELVEKNQTALEKSLQHYETSLKRLTEQIGDGFGSMLEYHLQNSYKNINDDLKANIGRITAGNTELIQRLQELFGQMAEQSRNETAAIINMNEQMNMRFDEKMPK